MLETVNQSRKTGPGQPRGMRRAVLHLRAHPAFPDAVASTAAGHIFLNLGGHRLSVAEWLRALGHECVHVLQQQAGRVQPEQTARGVSFNNNLELEAEADALAEACARACARGWLPPVAEHAGPAVLQNLIGIRQRPVRTQADLSPMAASLLPLIPGGAAWLAAVAAAPTQYQFEDELELLAGIQAGVHGDPVLLLRTLKLAVHPQALAPFSRDDIDSIVLAETSDDANSVASRRVSRLFAAQQLLAEPELAVADSFPGQVGIAGDEPVFRSVSLEGRIALFNLVDCSTSLHDCDPMLQKEAAAFAVVRSSNVFEFVDFYRFYMALVTGAAPDPLLASKRSRFAEATSDALSDVVTDLLWAPTLQTVPSISAMPGVIAAWAQRGFVLGFPRLSAALAFLARNVATGGATGQAVRTIIQAAMANLQQQWISNVPVSVRVSQSGGERTYSYQFPGATAQLSLSTQGTLTIADYSPTPPTGPAKTATP